jgi:tRNA 2-(methylsulfanyl)-N6-isopentenyladenosine37 hydroxylase
MLRLTHPTHPDWVAQAIDDVEALLIDHAHCEKKAASTAINLIFRYPEHDILLRPLSSLAREELAHFELVLTHLESRGMRYKRFKPSAYAGKLMALVRREEPNKLMDTLLCCALIEARSCERMKLLSEAFRGRDEALADLYQGLLASEARHHSMYIDLTQSLFDPELVMERLQLLSLRESELLSVPEPELRMHS